MTPSKALWFDGPTVRTHFGIGVGSLVMIVNPILLGCYTFGCHSFRHLVGGRKDVLSKQPDAQILLRLRVLPEPQPHDVGLDQHVLCGLRGSVHPPVRDGRLDGLENSLIMADYPVHEYDVLVVGAGGAGLRAAIEASAAGVKTGVVTKSLLGKAHTVMAEGGMAAAMGNVDDRDNWRVHFADTMRGGQYLNNCRMAELHAKEAPARVQELEAWGAMFDRTKDGKILQRNFGGHRYPRLAHVGDRTGLEMIRTLQDHGIHQGIEFHMETHHPDAAQGRRPLRGRVRLRSRTRAFHACFMPRPWCWRRAAIGRAFQVTSNSWEYTADGHALAYHAGAALLDMEFVQFHPTGMVWPPSVKGILVTEGVRGEGGVLRNKEGKRFMFDDIPENYRSQTADNPKKKAGATRKATRARGVRRSC